MPFKVSVQSRKTSYAVRITPAVPISCAQVHRDSEVGILVIGRQLVAWGMRANLLHNAVVQRGHRVLVDLTYLVSSLERNAISVIAIEPHVQ